MPELKLNGHSFDLKYPAVMGIINLTPDSFSDGGKYIEPADAVEQALKMHSEGAQIIDLGAESTRPGSDPVSEHEELSRILPVLEKIPKDQFLISIDTTKPEVASEALKLGVHIINDVSGGQQKLLNLARKHHAGFVLMHCLGTPKSMQNNPVYEDLLNDIRRFFDQKKDELKKLGLPRIWMDPGIGFGKTLEHNITLMKNLSFFKDDAWGLFIGSSRKSWIHHLCDAPEPHKRLGGSIASALSALQHNVEMIRVHDVLETVQAIKVAKELALFK